MSMSDIEKRLYDAFKDYEAELLAAERSGTISLELKIESNLSKNVTPPKLTVQFQHYNYSKFEQLTTTKGISLRETFNEFTHQLARDDKMLLLSKPIEELAEIDEEVPF